MRFQILPFWAFWVLVIVAGAGLASSPRGASASPLSGVAAVSAGAAHTCAVTTGGGVKCWGANGAGQLGDGTAADRLTPVDVLGLTNGVVTVSAGNAYTCALTTGGGVKCWGSNGYGQLGNGTTTDSHRPVDVSGLTSGMAAVSAGGSHTCALTTAGGLKCWGNNLDGELGDGTTTTHLTPVDVCTNPGCTAPLTGAAAVSAGSLHTCARTTAGGAKCWGDNSYGQLGTGPLCGTSCTTPVDVSGLISGVAAVSAGGSHTCALITGGGVKCWGQNHAGQLGNGVTTDSSTPVEVLGLNSGVAVSAGTNHSCALTMVGAVKCWGLNTSGQLGSGTTTYTNSTPLDVIGLAAGVAAVTGGFDHTCALTTAGGVKCWGHNSNGQLGDGFTTDSPTPVDVMTTPPYPAGDVNCDGAVNAIDAALVLQYSAGLLSVLPCQQNADVNRDGQVNSLDAALILQYDAGLIQSLPT